MLTGQRKQFSEAKLVRKALVHQFIDDLEQSNRSPVCTRRHLDRSVLIIGADVRCESEFWIHTNTYSTALQKTTYVSWSYRYMFTCTQTYGVVVLPDSGANCHLLPVLSMY